MGGCDVSCGVNGTFEGCLIDGAASVEVLIIKLGGTVILKLEHLVSEIPVFYLDVLGLVNALAGGEAVEVLSVFLILTLTAICANSHLLQLHHVLNLLGSRLVVSR